MSRRRFYVRDHEPDVWASWAVGGEENECESDEERERAAPRDGLRPRCSYATYAKRVRALGLLFEKQRSDLCSKCERFRRLLGDQGAGAGPDQGEAGSDNRDDHASSVSSPASSDGEEESAAKTRRLRRCRAAHQNLAACGFAMQRQERGAVSPCPSPNPRTHPNHVALWCAGRLPLPSGVGQTLRPARTMAAWCLLVT